jgi:hypothetical protein
MWCALVLYVLGWVGMFSLGVHSGRRLWVVSLMSLGWPLAAVFLIYAIVVDVLSGNAKHWGCR